jgi:tetratricopeptide (TPR) repeat protein
MKHLHVISILVLTISCGGTAQKKAGSSPKNAMKYQAKKVESFSANDCLQTKVETKDPRAVVAILNACVAKKDWNKVNDLALYLRSLDERSPWGYYYSSVSSEANSNMPESMWFIQKALDRDTNNAMFQYQLGRLLLIQGKEADAFVRFKEVLRFDPDHVEANALVAKIYYNNKVYDQALKHYEIVLSDEKSNEAIVACYVSAMQLNDYVKSLNYLRKIPRAQMTTEIRLDMAFLYEKTNDIAGAVEVYEDVLKQNKDKNTSFDSRQVSDKIKELRTQLRTIAAAKEEKEISK